MKSYEKVENMFCSYRNTIKTCSKENSFSQPSNKDDLKYFNGKINPKKHYYNEKVRKMKIKNIAQKIIPNAGKKNFKSDEV